MILYVNGDSHSHGNNVKNRTKTFASLLSHALDFELVNSSNSGASNDRIIRTTRDYLADNQPDLVVIGWSTWEREEWEHLGQYYNVNSSGHDQLPDVLITKYKQWVIEQTPETLVGKSQHTHEKIYKLHCELTEKQIPHVFFNCMYNFFEITNQLNWNHSYIGPYENDASYYWYLKKRNFATDDWYHYGEDGHKAWANFLIKYIEENKIL
jgi:hypothetical protein